MRPGAVRVGRLHDHRLCFDLPVGKGERGVATVVPEVGASVCGVLYLLAPEECLRLDVTEGVDKGYYARFAVVVRCTDGADVAAFTYGSPHRFPGRKPSARYLGLLLAGARAHGLPAEWIAHLEAFELACDERGGAREAS